MRKPVMAVRLTPVSLGWVARWPRNGGSPAGSVVVAARLSSSTITRASGPARGRCSRPRATTSSARPSGMGEVRPLHPIRAARRDPARRPAPRHRRLRGRGTADGLRRGPAVVLDVEPQRRAISARSRIAAARAGSCPRPISPAPASPRCSPSRQRQHADMLSDLPTSGGRTRT